MNRELDSALKDAWREVNETFPFRGYVNPARRSGYEDMVKLVAKWAKPGATVLDFGAGPCDKTAMFSLSGFDVTAFDTLEDTWHVIDNNRNKILEFANRVGIDYLLPSKEDELPFAGEQYDVVMSHDVFEHFHSSPRLIANKLVEAIKPGGILAITVPNAANLRKRLHLLLGKTNYNRFEFFYWYPGFWNGHVREYVRRDLILLNDYLGLDLLDLTTYSLQLDVLPKFAVTPYRLFSAIFPDVRDSWMLLARKPENWEPKLRPNEREFEAAFHGQYFDYSNLDWDWETK
jgi:2-polyprenyl-3-methyl-5-hydroxy-6-metoxy-1,4-benzoquinol methylase